MFTSVLLPTILALAGVLPTVSAHGHVSEIRIAGVSHRGRNPGSSEPQLTPIRAINDPSPVKGATVRDMNCGKNAQRETYSAEANPGDLIEFQWVSGELTPWPHDTGPILTYMTPCGAAGCQAFDPIDAEFFKIDEQGLDPNNPGRYVQAQLLEQNAPARVTLPTTLPAGEYLIRHEIIGLHLAQNQGGAEFYPSCIAIKLNAGPSNNATVSAIPTGAQTARFPGGYTDNDAGILLNPFGIQNYPFPGPQIADLSQTISAPPPAENVSAPPQQQQPCNRSSAKKRKVKRGVREVFGRRSPSAQPSRQASVSVQSPPLDLYHQHQRRNPEVIDSKYFAAKMKPRAAEPEVEIQHIEVVHRPRSFSRVMKAII